MSLPTVPPGSKQPVQGKSEWAKFIASFGYAFSGLWYTIRTQRNMRVHLTIALLALLVGVFLRISPVEFAIIFLAIICVFTAEMFNTVLELCVDLASPEYSPLAKIAKDVAAGTVLLSAIISVIIGLFIFLPHIIALFHR
jgi:diacylglycerol kinase